MNCEYKKKKRVEKKKKRYHLDHNASYHFRSKPSEKHVRAKAVDPMRIRRCNKYAIDL